MLYAWGFLCNIVTKCGPSSYQGNFWKYNETSSEEYESCSAFAVELSKRIKGKYTKYNPVSHEVF